MALTKAAMMGDLQSHIDAQVHETLSALPHAQEGTIIGGSYDPTEATAEMMFGSTLPILGDEGDTFINHRDLVLGTTMPGDLYGPTGLERCIAVPCAESGYILFYRHGPDDVPMVPAGERWILHRSVATQGVPNPVYDAGIKFTNDGPTPGDGGGGTTIGNQGILTQAVTNSGHMVALNDTAQTITVQTAGGMQQVYNDAQEFIRTTASFGSGGSPLLYTLLDVTGAQSGGIANSISHVVPNGGILALGANAGSLGNSFAAVNQTLMNNVYSPLVNAFGLTNLRAFATALGPGPAGAGIITGTQLTELLAIVISSWLTGVEKFTGSNIVQIAS